MERRNKRNIAIGILCTLLVFMGVGYAALNQVLDINGTARSTNAWSIVIKSITEKESVGAINKGASVGSDRISANFEAEFTKPGDYITYEIVVKNEGTLPAKIDRINTILPNAETATQQELSDLSLFGLEYDESIIGKALSAGSSETFTVTVRYRSGATRLPYGDVHAGIEIVAVQDTTGGSGDIKPEPAGDDWLYKVDSNGLITDFNYDSPDAKDEAGNYIANVPPYITKIVNGKEVQQNIISINDISFARKNLLMSGDYTKIVITDKAKADEIEEMANIFFTLMGFGMPTIEEDPMDFTSYFPLYFDTQKYNEYKENGVTITVSNFNEIFSVSTIKSLITKLDLSQATNLTTIGNGAFYQDNLTTVNLGNTVTTIGNMSFEDNQIDGELIIPNSVITIGYQAFSNNKISSLTIPDSLTTIESFAFYQNQISGELIIPNSVTTIGGNAFSNNQISGELIIPNSVTTIVGNAFSNNQISNLTLGNGLKTIDYNAFRYNQISNLVIPNNVTTIRSGAFSNQKDSANNNTLASITIKRTEQDFLTNVTGADENWYDKTLPINITYDPS